MGWSWANIDWTATGVLAALFISSAQTGVSVWSVRRSDQGDRERAILSKQLQDVQRDRAIQDRRLAIDHAVGAIDNAARELREVVIPVHAHVRLSEETQAAIMASVEVVGSYLRQGQEVDAYLSIALAKTEQILSRVREIMPPNEAVYPSSQAQKVSLLAEQARNVRGLLLDYDGRAS